MYTIKTITRATTATATATMIYHKRIPKVQAQPSFFFSLGLLLLLLQQLTTVTSANNNNDRPSLTDDTIRDAVALYLSDDPSDIGTLFSQYGEISDWDTSQVTDFSYLFQGATKQLAHLDLTSWNISSATTLQGMFQDASNLNGNTFCFSTWKNHSNNGNGNVNVNVNVEDMFCGTDGSLDPCCTPAPILEDSCCQTKTATCNSICLGANIQFPLSSPSTSATVTASPTTTTTTTTSTTVSGEGSYVFQPNAPDDDFYNTASTNTTSTTTAEEDNRPTVVQVATDNTNSNNNNNNANNNNSGIPWYQSEFFLGFLGFFVGSLVLALAALMYKKRKDRAKKATELHSDELMLSDNNNGSGKPSLESMVDIEIQPTVDSSGSDDNHMMMMTMMEYTGIECNLSRMVDDTYLTETEEGNATTAMNNASQDQTTFESTDVEEQEHAASTTENDTSTANDKSLYSL